MYRVCEYNLSFCKLDIDKCIELHSYECPGASKVTWKTTTNKPRRDANPVYKGISSVVGHVRHNFPKRDVPESSW